jgi:hypothetical protein
MTGGARRPSLLAQHGLAHQADLLIREAHQSTAEIELEPLLLPT